MTIVTTTIEINSAPEMARRLERKNNKAQLTRALGSIWGKMVDSDVSDEDFRNHVEEVMSNAVWGY